MGMGESGYRSPREQQVGFGSAQDKLSTPRALPFWKGPISDIRFG
jgi:hypothetical protein